MKILYVAVHSHTGWGAEFWLARAFRELGIRCVCYDYRRRRRRLYWRPWWYIGRELRRMAQRESVDLLFLQRAEHMPASVLAAIPVPIVFWSTEPIQLKTDVDQLLRASPFAHVFVHSYSCLQRLQDHFPHQVACCSVMHNGCPAALIDGTAPRTRLAIFNRSLSPRRRGWLKASDDLVEVIGGRFGQPYFDDLASSHIALNVHYSDRNLDDLESGIFEAMAKGCVVVSERLNPLAVQDCGLADALVQVDSPMQMREAILRLRDDPALMALYRTRALQVVRRNTWEERAARFKSTFRRLLRQDDPIP